MRDKWTGTVVAKMHIYGIRQGELAEKLKISAPYLSDILNCKEKPKDGKKKILEALDAIIAERGEIETR